MYNKYHKLLEKMLFMCYGEYNMEVKSWRIKKSDIDDYLIETRNK